MADSPVFDHVCAALERRCDMDRITARGTVRIALKAAGLEASSIDASQMKVVLERVLPGELTTRGIESAEGLCGAIASEIGGMTFDVGQDRAGSAADALARMGS